MGFWTYAELSMGVVCGCLPVSPKFFQTVSQKLSTMAGSGSSLRTMLGGSAFRLRSTRRSQDSDEAKVWQTPYAAPPKLHGSYTNLDEHEIDGKGAYV